MGIIDDSISAISVFITDSKGQLSLITRLRYHDGMTKTVPDPLATDARPVRDRILKAAAALIARSGVETATTRAVAAEAGVQAPTIYRLFGDKDGLLEAVAEATLVAYVDDKAVHPPDPDPVEEMRQGWDRHVAFALAHPGIFAIMEARPETPRDTPAMRRGIELLRTKVRAVAASGRLRMPEDRAVDLFHGTGMGIISTLLRQKPADRDMDLSREARECAIAAITGAATTEISSGTQGAANALHARLPEIDGLSAGERLLLSELLYRIVSTE